MIPDYFFEITDGLSADYCFSYFDTKDNLALLLFSHYHLDVTIEEVYGKEEEPYRIVLCRIPKEQREQFLRTLTLLPSMMAYAGHADYEDYCRAVMMEADSFRTEHDAAGITPLQ